MDVASYSTQRCPNDINLFEQVATRTYQKCGF